VWLVKYANAAAYVAVITMNILANALPLNGQTQEMISERFDVLITPAGFAFSIWGLIYLLLGGFIVGGFLRDRRRVRRIGGPFLVSCAANIGWLVAWHWNAPVLALGFMILLLASLIVIKTTLVGDPPEAPWDRWTADIPFAVYLGWISVATIVNVAVVLYATGWAGLGIGSVTWTIIMSGVAGVLALVVLRAWRSIAFALVVSWALFGVAMANVEIPVLFSVALGVSLGLLLRVIYVALQSRGRLA